MGQRKEVHGNIPVCHERQSDIMNAESLSIIEMMEHDTFRLTGSTGSIKDIGEVIIWGSCCTFFYNGIVLQLFIHCHKFIKIDGSHVARIFHHSTVEDDELLQRLAKSEHAESGIVLELLAYKQITYLCIVDDILCLGRWAGSIQRYSHRPVGECTEISKETFGFILREDTDILLWLYSQSHHCIGSPAYSLWELFPRDGYPLCSFIVPVFQGYFVSILLCLAMHQDR